MFAGVARHLKPGGRAAFHLASAEMLGQPLPDVRGPALIRPIEGGRRLVVSIADRSSKPQIGRYDQTIEYVVEGPRGVEARSLDHMTFYAADPRPFAEAVGLQADGTAPLGPNLVHLFRKPG